MNDLEIKTRCGGHRQVGLTIVEALIGFCLIGLLSGVFIPRIQQVTRTARESALKAELSNIRTSIRLYKMLNGKNPDSLKELIEKKIVQPGRIGPGLYSDSFFDEHYLLKNAVDETGNKLDAFSNPFLYDHNLGSVRTTTQGYETW